MSKSSHEKPSINTDAAKLLAALGLSEALTREEANADKYYTATQIAAMKRGLTVHAVWRAIRANPERYDSVRITGKGGERAYRLKR